MSNFNPQKSSSSKNVTLSISKDKSFQPLPTLSSHQINSIQNTNRDATNNTDIQQSQTNPNPSHPKPPPNPISINTQNLAENRSLNAQNTQNSQMTTTPNLPHIINPDTNMTNHSQVDQPQSDLNLSDDEIYDFRLPDKYHGTNFPLSNDHTILISQTIDNEGVVNRTYKSGRIE